MTIHVHFWSYFKDVAGQEDVEFEVPPGTTLGQLQDVIGLRFPKMASLRGCTLASVGVDYQTSEHLLSDGDQVSLSPGARGLTAFQAPCRSEPAARIPLVKRSLHIGPEPIDEPALVAQRAASSGMGAALYFSGMVRGTEKDSAISGIEYEAFLAMATHQFQKLFDELERRWPCVESIRLIHRIGLVRVGESSLWIEILSPHRGEGFAAGQWIIDQMKQVVPIWKRPLPESQPGTAPPDGTE